MPHLSPMLWTLMFFGTWMLISFLIFSMVSQKPNYYFEYKKSYLMKHKAWNWFQGGWM